MGLFLTVWTPSGVSVVSMIQVGNSAPLRRVLAGSGSTRSVGGARCGYAGTMRRLIAALLPVGGHARARGRGADAATLAPLKACYVSAGEAVGAREPIDVNAQGFTPNATATVLLDGAVIQAQAQIDPMGGVVGPVPAPFQASGQRPFTLSIIDNTNPSIAVSAEALVTALDVRVRPANAKPSSRVRFRGRGFTGGPAVYAHYLRKGRLRKTVPLATATGPCGTFDVRRRQLPIKRPRDGRWMVQIDQDPVFRETPSSVSVQLTIDVSREPRIGSLPASS